MNYAAGIKKAREHANLSKRKLASLAGFDTSYIGLLESGKRVPSLEALESIAKATMTPMGLLLLLCAEDNDLKGLRSREARTLTENLQRLLDDTKND
jgi:transcriptional regulator with XRE-family HTH domain